jgi:hypothetical protein
VNIGQNDDLSARKGPNVTLLPRRNFARHYCAMQKEFLEEFEEACAMLIKINIYGTFFYAALAQFRSIAPGAII